MTLHQEGLQIILVSNFRQRVGPLVGRSNKTWSMFRNGDTDKQVWFVKRRCSNESNKDSYAGLTAGENSPKIESSSCSRYLTTSALGFTVP